MLELRQHDGHNLQVMDPLDNGERTQYRVSCSRSSYAHVMDKALRPSLGWFTFFLHVIASVLCRHHAQNRRGISDFQDPPHSPRVPPSHPSTLLCAIPSSSRAPPS
jgi:hypothetical protein